MPTGSEGLVLVVEDHADIRAIVGEALEDAGFTVDYASDGHAGFERASRDPFDLLVLDRMLPGQDGLTLCRRLRDEAALDVPVLMLTAMDTLEDKVAGLDAGADDYLVKPFAIRELVARVRALRRRGQGAVARGVLRVEDLELDQGQRTVSRSGRRIRVTPVGFRILAELMRASPRVVARPELERALWGDDPPDSDALRSHLYNLRKVVDREADVPLIHTLPQVGYRVGPPDG